MVLREKALLCLVFICLCLVPVPALDITCPSWSLSLSTVLLRPPLMQVTLHPPSVLTCLAHHCVLCHTSSCILGLVLPLDLPPYLLLCHWLLSTLSGTTQNPHTFGQLFLFPAHLTATTTTSFLAMSRARLLVIRDHRESTTHRHPLTLGSLYSQWCSQQST